MKLLLPTGEPQLKLSFPIATLNDLRQEEEEKFMGAKVLQGIKAKHPSSSIFSLCLRKEALISTPTVDGPQGLCFGDQKFPFHTLMPFVK